MEWVTKTLLFYPLKHIYTKVTILILVLIHMNIHILEAEYFDSVIHRSD